MGDCKTVPRGSNETFQFKLEGSKKVWGLPLLSRLQLSEVRKLRDVPEGDDAAALDAVADILDRHCPGLTDIIGIDEMGALMEMWYGASGITLGESSASAD